VGDRADLDRRIKELLQKAERLESEIPEALRQTKANLERLSKQGESPLARDLAAKILEGFPEPPPSPKRPWWKFWAKK
jgi:hypothetical protein